ncbi:vascular endothelial growth factor receptor 1-like isoform X1 [Daphnia pulicaria]|uniref:vascular endothelial growth factor receptor 1-like isoform X1 n=1 Tax=Daphnia pulicaria TaxID=35523 RepID=UPI001EEB6B18|nr:vascular endothelial growth factor receptor 1-like isoform X1 [Daphnia pulicaria]
MQLGIEVERVGAPDDPVEGSNVTLICTFYAISTDRRAILAPPTWFYYANRNETWQKLSKDFLKEPNADIRNEIEQTPDGFYKRKLNLINVTLNTPYTKFKCVADNVFIKVDIFRIITSAVKEISFTIKEIDNDPVSNNSIAIEKGVGKNLICNRWSQDVAIHWFKDGMAHSDLIYENETASVVQLQGKEKEKGTYECRWKNSKGEPRHRNFRVGIISYEKDEKDANTIIISASFIGLLAVAVAIGIKVYLDKRNVEKQLEKRLNGDPNRIVPDVPMEYQTEFLPYDKKWEFPRKRLRLGQELGSGCFGRVVKAEAVGIKGYEETVTAAAVKMINPTAKANDALDALIRELKILIYLGPHLNVVNLMGACTKTLVKEEILVIIDFCRFGNLKSYLIEHRDKFINQLNALGNLLPGDETVEINTPTK